MADESEVDAPDVLTSRKSSVEEPMRPHEADVVEWVEGLLTEAQTAKQDQCDPQEWERDLNTFTGGGWPDVLPSWKPRIVINEIQSLVLQELSDLTDSRVKIYVQKQRGSTQRDETVEDSISTFWRRRSCDMVCLQASLDAMVYPLGFLQTGWNPQLEQGQGDIIFTSRDPNTVYIDPDAQWDPATDMDTMAYFLFDDVLDIAQIRDDFPETGELVMPEAAFSIPEESDRARPQPRAGSGYTGPLYTRLGLGTGVPGWKKARARFITCVVDDRDKVEEINSIGGQLRQVKKLRYPHRRMILVANKRVLYDDDCPYYYAPILTPVRLQPSVHSYWPRQSLVNQFAEIQNTANKLDSLVAENALRLNVGKTFLDADCGIQGSKFGDVPGAWYFRKPGSKIETVYPSPMPADMVNAGEKLRGNIRTTMGYPASRTGAGTHGNVAAELVETEISQSMGLTRLRGRLMYQSVQKAVEMIFARAAQFWTIPRHLPYIEGGEVKAVKWEPIAKPEDYVVHVDESSFRILSKTMEKRLALTLGRMGKISTLRLLKALDIPDADAAWAELKEELVLRAAANEKQRRAKNPR